jgi:hypothetical protein
VRTITVTDPRISERTPTQVALYTNATDPPQRVAVFRWSARDGVTLELLDPESRFARQLYERGVDLLPERRMALPAEGPVFMRALLQPFRMSYHTLRDESTPE